MRLIALALVSVSALACVQARAAEHALEVRLRAESVVAGALFTVGELAIVEGRSDDAAGDALRALKIGRSPRAGTALALTRAEVEQAILRLSPELRGALRVSGAERLVLRRGPLQTIEPARVREAAAAELRAFLTARFTRFEFEPLDGAAAPFSVPPGKVEILPRVAASSAIPERLSVWTEVHVDGRHYQSVPIAFRVTAYQTVLAATQAQRAGERVRVERFAPREQQVAGLAQAPVPAQTDLAPLRLRRPLRAGEVLTWGHVESAPVVARNEEIRVELAVGGISLETTGTATEDGRPGEVIRVRAAGGRETFPARVVAAGTVEALWR